MKLFDFFRSKKVYFFGDSHISVWQNRDKILGNTTVEVKCSELNKCFVLYKTGPDLAFNLIKKDEILNRIKKIRRGSTIVLNYGEIDCRVFLVEKGNVNECVMRYVEFIKKLSMIYNVIVVAPFPTTGSNYSDVEFPTTGTHLQRNLVTLNFTRLLGEYTIEFNFKMISIYNELTTDNITNMKYFMDQIHLSTKAYPLLIEKLKSVL